MSLLIRYYNNATLRGLSCFINISSHSFCTQEVSAATSKKKTTVPKITLISGSSLSVTTLEEAQKLSRRRDLKLVKIVDLDTKTQRPVYKLMSGSEYFQEDVKQRQTRNKKTTDNFIKGEKIVLLNDTISDHDIEIQANKVLKWLSKYYRVNVSISTSDTERSEKVFNSLEKFVGAEGRILQKNKKGSVLKFQIIPPKKETEGDL